MIYPILFFYEATNGLDICGPVGQTGMGDIAVKLYYLSWNKLQFIIKIILLQQT